MSNKRRIYGGVEVHYPWPVKQEWLQNSASWGTITPHEVILPMKQGPGAPCEPVVSIGDTVHVGQLIGKSETTMSGFVHASVSGQVSAISEKPLAAGSGLTVTIQNDGLNTLSGDTTQKNEKATTNQEIIDAIRQAGILGMGGAAFPTHVKLETDKTIDLLVVNGCECEPMLSADDALMQRESEQIIRGCRYAMQVVGAQRAVIGVERNKPRAAMAMKVQAQSYVNIQIEELDTLYPQGGEKQLIQAVAGREVPGDGGLPADVGIVVLNVATCAAIAGAVEYGRPLTQRICTVTGDIVRPQNLLFPIGTTAQDMIDACGGARGVLSKVIIGGPMMGTTIERLDVPLLKGANGLVVVCEQHDQDLDEHPCIRCNRCADACPMRLMPLFLDDAWRREKVKWYKRFKADSCINCGCCTYVCPARRRLAENIVQAKNDVMRRKKEGRA